MARRTTTSPSEALMLSCWCSRVPALRKFWAVFGWRPGVRNLTVTLHRLRHLLGAHAAVLQRAGKLTLNERVCWVDVWSFERAVNDGLRQLHEAACGDAAELQLRAALSLYSGHFLSRESEESWMLAPQLRLKTKFERLVAALSMHPRKPGSVCRGDRSLPPGPSSPIPLNELLYRRYGAVTLRGRSCRGRAYIVRCRKH